MPERTSSASGRPTYGRIDRRRLLRGTAGAAAAVVTLPALGGVAAAHFPAELDIDVQPENADNFIDLDDHDSVRIAVHRTEFLNSDGERETFDPTERDVRYRFGSRATLDDGGGAHPMDDGTVENPGDGDRSDDAMVLEFPASEAGLDGGEETVWLYWERDESGSHGFAGFDTVSVYNADRSDRDLVELLGELLRLAS